MKKKLVALVSALTLLFGMSTAVYASNSVDAKAAADKYTDSVLQNMSDKTSVEGPAGTTITKVNKDAAVSAALYAKDNLGANAKIAAIVELTVPEGTAPGTTITLKNADIKEGDVVIILHQKKDGTWEQVVASAVGAGFVKFSLSEYSPIAVVVTASKKADTNANTDAKATTTTTTSANPSKAPKTGDYNAVLCLMAMACFAGTLYLGKKAKRR